MKWLYVADFYQSHHQPSHKNIKYTTTTQLMTMFCKEITNAWLFQFPVCCCSETTHFSHKWSTYDYCFLSAAALKAAIFSQFSVQHCYCPRLGSHYNPPPAASLRDHFNLTASSIYWTSALTIERRIARCQNSDQYFNTYCMKTSDITFTSIFYNYAI